MQVRVSRCPLSASEVEWRGSARSFPDLALRLAPDSRPASVLSEYIGGSWGVDPACAAFHLNMSDDGNEADRITDVSCSGRALSSILLVPGAEELRVTVRLRRAAELRMRAVGGAPRVVRDAASGLDEVEHDEDPMRCWGCRGGITKVSECLEMICGHTHCGDCANAICAAGGEVTCRCAYCGMESMTLNQARGSRQLEQVQRTLLREEEGRGGSRMPVDGADENDGEDATTTTTTARRAERVSAVKEQVEQVLALMAEDTTEAEQREVLAPDAVLRRLCECRDALTAMATCAHGFVLGYQPSLLSADSACPSSLRRAVDVALHSTPSLSSLDLEVRAWLLRLAKTDIRTGPRRIARMHAAAHFGECGTIELLHALGADVEAKSVVNSNATPMHAAAAAGGTSAVLALHRLGADVTKRTERGWTPLHYAAAGGHIDTVLALHRLGADVNAPAPGGVTPLFSAATHGHTAVVLLLHHVGGAVDKVIPISASSPASIAASRGHVATVMLLHSLGADFECDGVVTGSPVSGAASDGRASTVVVLARLGVNVTTTSPGDLTSPMVTAVSKGWTITALLLHALGATLDVPPRTFSWLAPISVAALYGHLPILLAFVGLGVDVCGPDALNDALIAAAGNGQSAAVLLLASLGANVNASKNDSVTAEDEGMTAVHTACQRGHTAVLQMLHTLGASIDTPNTNGDTAMYAASARSHVATGMLLCQLGADVNARREGTGETALHMAVQRQNVALVCFLHGAGADVNVQAADGATPLFTASRRGDDAIVHLLISSFGADPNKPNSRGMTPIAAAAAEGHVSTVLLLASSGADVNTAALHAAVPKGDIAMVRALCERGADVNQVNAGGDAPLATAAMAAQADAVTVLAQFGADIRAARHDGATALRLVPLSSGRLPLVRPSRQAARTLRVLHGMGAEEW